MTRWRDNQFMQTLFVAVLLYGLWRLRVVVVILFVAFLLSTIGYPLVAYLKRHRFPTFFAIFLPIVIVLGVLSLLFYLLLPPFGHKVGDFGHQLPAVVNTLNRTFHLKLNSAHLSSYINSHFNNLSRYAFLVTGRLLEVIAGLLTILVLSIYWLGSYDHVKTGVLSVFRPAQRPRVKDIWRRIEMKLQLWFKAHLMLNTAVGIMVWISMTLLGVPFPQLLGLVAFLVEIIPTAGPFIAGAPAVVLGLTQSVLKAVLVIVVYAVIQQIESHALSPMLLGKTVRLHPIVIIASLLIGGKIYGIIGALLAVPTALCISAVVDSYRNDPLPGEEQKRKASRLAVK